MTEMKTAWMQVGDDLTALCLKLKLHAEQELSDDGVRERAGLDRIRAAVADAVDAVNAAYQDDAVREDAREMARSFESALDATIEDVRQRIASRT